MIGMKISSTGEITYPKIRDLEQHIIRTKLILGINKIKYHRLLREN